MITELRELDDAIKKYFSIYIVPVHGQPSVELKPKFINPQAQLNPKEYPLLVLDRAGDYNNPYKWENKSYVVGETTVGALRTKEVIEPEPITVYYTIRLYAKSHSEMSDMVSQLRHKLRRGAYITLLETQCPIYQLSFRNPDSTTDGYGGQKANEQREFIGQYLFKVETGLIHDRQPIKTVSQDKNFITIKSKE